MKEDPSRTAIKIATTAVFTALVCVVTLVFVVGIPATNGYFNIGETMIYIAALSFGPYVGAFAGGVGAAIADLVAAPIFAPGTLVIKGCEGAIVGFLNKKMFKQASGWRIWTILLGVIVGVLLASIGSVYLRNADIYWGIPPPLTFTISIPSEAWYLLGGIVALSIALSSFRLEAQSGRAMLSILIGGLEMVLGYFLYELLVLGKTAAIVEIAANIVQILVGLIVAIPITRII
ncbi:ECF transporter S component, partial [Candidatus Bathyarchaeota archaeon]|nr:ECF transporter S component [Candidatus Bathyarchaeota archaeon]